MMVIQHHTSAEWLTRCKDQFDRLYAEGAVNPRVMALAVHPYISGVPHRIKYFEAVYDYIRSTRASGSRPARRSARGTRPARDAPPWAFSRPTGRSMSSN